MGVSNPNYNLHINAIAYKKGMKIVSKYSYQSFVNSGTFSRANAP